MAEEQPKEETTMNEEVLTANIVAQGGALFLHTHSYNQRGCLSQKGLDLL